MSANLTTLAFDHRESLKNATGGTMSRSGEIADIAATYRHSIDVYEEG